jgi:aminopeptidase N
MKPMKRMTQTLIAFILITAGVCLSCSKSRRAEIEQRKAALVHKQDSALAEAQQRLAVVDSLLEVAKAEHDRQHDFVMSNSTKFNDQSPEVLRLNQLRAHRDSLQVEWQTLGAKIKYIRKVKSEE